MINMKILRERSVIQAELATSIKNKRDATNKNDEAFNELIRIRIQFKTLKEEHNHHSHYAKSSGGFSTPEIHRVKLIEINQKLGVCQKETTKWVDCQNNARKVINLATNSIAKCRSELQVLDHVEHSLKYMIETIKYIPELACRFNIPQACIVDKLITVGEVVMKLYEAQELKDKGECLGPKYIEIGVYLLEKELPVSLRLVKDKVVFVYEQLQMAYKNKK